VGKTAYGTAGTGGIGAMKPKTAPTGEKVRLTVLLPSPLVDRVKDAVYWTPGLTLSELAEEAFTAALQKRERGRKKPFPPRHGKLKAGRPLK
jgi:hypothetical protein